MSLMYFISERFGAKISMQQLMNEKTSIRSLARSVGNMQETVSQRPKNSLHAASVDTIAEINRHDSRISQHQVKIKIAAMVEGDPTKGITGSTVFLTGASGYMGTQILRQLLEHRQLDVWVGDLSLPRLGLDSTNWDLLTDGKSVDVIIHNGVAVHWAKSYHALEATNVCSTVDLLVLALSSPSMRFVYVSNRRTADSEDQTEEDVARSLVHVDSIAYSQTKFVSEALIKRAAGRDACASRRLAVVSPGYVVGTPTEGIGNADDYVWRLVAACIRVGAYNADEATATIIKSALQVSSEAGSKTVRPIMDGITWGGIWSIVSGMGHPLRAMSAREWLGVVRADIQQEGERHPLWPLAHILDRQKVQAEGKVKECYILPASRLFRASYWVNESTIY
ncbi:putative L-aminoadipate-semialdehyde dehydrogenase large subunit [Glarea lozoyensis 74030]|uniref:Putative L-aminoadipate-semialdehyde dehydrogenase large subunit n=1 Tax=Glarea lozoyensis (strain ATCC 74030 / MF5533) TaxID=1104152 RepID=H0EH71_GLAL7|nr:putative L-aminoadipate-semialdehyde dehydrogenase large subunit [Glarea lozoyensis 74030]